MEKDKNSLQKQLAEIIATEKRDGSCQDIDELRRLRDNAYSIASGFQKLIDQEIQEKNGWNKYINKWVYVEKNIYVYVNNIERLYGGCRFLGNIVDLSDDETLEIILNTVYDLKTSEFTGKILSPDEMKEIITKAKDKIFENLSL